jgi:flavin reductase (DIM6/NTAB) family NADH-FMN oxidoreductase RutF
MINIFCSVNRDEIRRIFQPSKIVLAIVFDSQNNRYNMLPLCFHMWCSYSPLQYVIAIHKNNYSSILFQEAKEYVLAIPGEKMIDTVMYCGTHSGKHVNKSNECKIEWSPCHKIKTPGIDTAIANIEFLTKNMFISGDHYLIIGEAITILRNRNNNERLLLSVGPKKEGFEILAQNGIHTIGVIPKN